ncbi:MAG: peptide MFS transporter [Myxococcales bacterium]|nr:peptide MFS transporter [Myxococcales bacterium]
MATTAPSDDRAFFGHPRGLMTLFMLELWERFSYYGMRAFLVIFIITPVAQGGLGESKTTAGIIYAMYGSLVYLMSLPGGWLADRFLGQQKAVLYGGIIIMAGHIVLAVPSHSTFYMGLGLIIIGTGLLKPNASTIVGQLYDKNDIRRDAGYSIFYMGINIGAFIAPIACGYLAQSNGFRARLVDAGINPNNAWHFGFGAAAVGMGLGIAMFSAMRHHLGAAGRDPAPRKPVADRAPLPMLTWIVVGVAAAVTVAFGTWRLSSGVDKKAIADAFGVGLGTIAVAVFVIMHQVVAANRDEKNRVLAMAVLFFGCLSFFGIFEQAGSTLSFFAEERTQRNVLGIDFPSSYWQFVNAGWVIMLAPVFTWLWVWLAKQGKEPFSVNKFAIGMVIAGVAFVPLFMAIPAIDRGERSSAGYLLTYYFFATCAEMCISPVGLSVMNKLAPERLASFVMGVWFLAISIGLYIAGRAEVEVGKLSAKLEWGTGGVFYLIMIFALVVAAMLFIAAGPVRRMLAGSAPLPQAKATEA